MARINVLEFNDFDDIDEAFENFEKREPSRKSMEPVSGKHDFQYRAQCGVNRHRKNKEVRV